MKPGSLPWVTHRNGLTLRAACAEDCEQARALMVRTFAEDFGYGYQPDVHSDIDDLVLHYIDHPDHALVVAIDEETGSVVATSAMRRWNRRHPEHPDWLHARYQALPTVELLRAYTAANARRRGAQRELTELLRLWVTHEQQYRIVNLHTNTSIPGAEPFWRSLAYEVLDSRPCPFHTVHFELPLHWPVRGAQGPDRA